MVHGRSDGRRRACGGCFPDVNDLIRLVRASLTRGLTQAQRDAYGPRTEHPSEDRNFIRRPRRTAACPG